MQDYKKQYETVFGQRLIREGVHCTHCVREEDKVIWSVGDGPADKYPGLAARRFRKAYEIKTSLGLLTNEESIAVPVLVRLSQALLATEQDSIWYRVHGSKDGASICIRPSLWQIGWNILELKALLEVFSELEKQTDAESVAHARQELEKLR